MGFTLVLLLRWEANTGMTSCNFLCNSHRALPHHSQRPAGGYLTLPEGLQTSQPPSAPVATCTVQSEAVWCGGYCRWNVGFTQWCSHSLCHCPSMQQSLLVSQIFTKNRDYATPSWITDLALDERSAGGELFASCKQCTRLDKSGYEFLRVLSTGPGPACLAEGHNDEKKHSG